MAIVLAQQTAKEAILTTLVPVKDVQYSTSFSCSLFLPALLVLIFTLMLTRMHSLIQT